MAPLKLKFRMGSSRNTSQETQELDTTDTNNINQALLINTSMNNEIRDSNSTIDSIDCTSLDSTGGNDKKSLLPNITTNDRLGYLNPAAITQNSNNSYKMNDNKIENLDVGSQLSISTDNSTSAIPLSESSSECIHNNSSELDGYYPGSSSNFNSSVNLNKLSPNISTEHITLNSIKNNCIEPNCKINNNNLKENSNKKINEEDICKESIDSREYLITPGSEIEQVEQIEQHENNINNSCTGSCETLYQQENYTMNTGRDNNDYKYEESTNYDNNSIYNNGTDNPDDDRNDDYSERSWNSNTTQIISNKSSKKIYKAVAKQFGITCTMSDQCRCMECQSNYFDCEFDENEHQKMDHTDGGLGAGTPMFISEVMHGSACNIL